MQDFWRLVSIIVCLLGFGVTGGLLFYRGETFALSVVKAIGAFIGLYIIQKTLGGILASITGFVKPSEPVAETADEKPAVEKAKSK